MVGSATRGARAAAAAALAGASGITLGVAEQLLAAARAVAGSAQLRSLLADPAVSGADKTTIVERVFPGADQAARDLLVSAVDQRWSSPDELTDGLEELGIRAAALAAGKDPVEGELFAFGRAVTSDPQLELAISSKLGDSAGKVALVDRLVGTQASAATIAILEHLVQSARGRRIGAMLRDASAIVADEAGRVVATVTSATPLSTAQQRRLSDALAAKYGLAPHLNVVVDPALIGGLRVQIADDVIDGSIASRIQDLRIQLAG